MAAHVGDERARRPGTSDIGFILLLTLYAAGGILVLGQGLGALAASWSEGLHATLHLNALGDGFVARVSQRMADASHGVSSPLQVGLDYLFSGLNLGLAALVLWLRPRDRTARSLCLGLVGIAGVFNLTAQATMEQLPLFGWESAAQLVAHLMAGFAYALALLWFPDGVMPPLTWRWGFALLALPLALIPRDTRAVSLLLFFGVLIPAAGAGAQGYRLRHGETIRQRQQARLLFWALLLALAVGAAFVATRGLTPSAELAGRHLVETDVLLFRVFQIVFALIPITLLAGLVHYRLWDIDRLINRTLVYGFVTTLLASGYVAIVVLLEVAFGSAIGFNTEIANSKIVVAGSTLVLASAFRPLRDRIQRFVDRRFYRRRYDAARTVEAFSARLRDQVDLTALTRQVEWVVRDVMQPAHVSVWLRDRAESPGPDPRNVTVTASGQESGAR